MNEHSFMVIDERRETHEAIVDAALELFTERSYASTTVPDIARRAGVAAGTIYRYFPSKEALANAIYQQEKLAMKDALTASLAELPPSADSRSEALACWAALLGMLEDHRPGVLFLEAQQHAAYLNDASRAIAAEVDLIAWGVVDRGQRTALIRRGDPAVLVAMFFGAFVGLAKLSGIAPGSLDSTADAAWDLIAAKELS